MSFRDAARAVIGCVPGFDLIGEATSGEEAVALVEDRVRTLDVDESEKICRKDM